MSRIAALIIAVLALATAPSLAAQAKPKDPVLMQYLQTAFDQLTAKIEQINTKLAANAAKLDQLDQKQAALDAELRNEQNLSKSIDTSLSTLRLSSQQDLFSLKTDLAQTRQDLSAVAELVRRSFNPGAPTVATVATSAPAPAIQTQPAERAAASAPVLEGYITGVEEDEMTINLGSGAGLKAGAQFNIYKAADPKTTIGVAEIVQVTDTNNSRAKVVFIKPDVHLEFSDSVRLK